MDTQITAAGLAVVALVIGSGLGGLQWLILRRLLRRLDERLKAVVLGAGAGTALCLFVTLRSLEQAGLPQSLVWPLGLGCLLVSVLGGAAVLGIVWLLARPANLIIGAGSSTAAAVAEVTLKEG